MSKIVVANWKMNPQSQKEAEVLFNALSKGIKDVKNTKIVVCPPSPFLYILKKIQNKKFILGAQDVGKNMEGSHTGEVSSLMLASMGVKYVIVGHSERRSAGEDNKIVNQKLLNLLKSKLSPILCVGESNRDKEGKYLSFVGEQIKECLAGVSRPQMSNVIIAYEPIWAIGSGAVREATKEEFMEMKIYIKKTISDIYGAKIAHSTIILYGGSVNPFNAGVFVADNGADGLLVGRDSLNPKKFSAILSTIK